MVTRIDQGSPQSEGKWYQMETLIETNEWKAPELIAAYRISNNLNLLDDYLKIIKVYNEIV